MISSESLITDADLAQAKVEANPADLQRNMLALFAREPKLAEVLAPHWNHIERMCDALKLNDHQKEMLGAQISFMTSESLLLLDRAHRRLWDGFLPASSTAKNGDNHV